MFCVWICDCGKVESGGGWGDGAVGAVAKVWAFEFVKAVGGVFASFWVRCEHVVAGWVMLDLNPAFWEANAGQGGGG